MSAETVCATARALRAAAPGRAALLVGGRATRAGALAAAGRIAAACGARLLGEVFLNRVEAGRGRVPLQRIPYPVDAALALLRDIELLVLVDAPAPVAFFAYPGKPGSLLPETCRVLTLCGPADDGGRR